MARERDARETGIGEIFWGEGGKKLRMGQKGVWREVARHATARSAGQSEYAGVVTVPQSRHKMGYVWNIPFVHLNILSGGNGADKCVITYRVRVLCCLADLSKEDRGIKGQKNSERRQSSLDACVLFSL